MQKVLTAFRFTVRPSYKIFVKVDKTCIITLHKYRIKGIDKLLNFFIPEMYLINLTSIIYYKASLKAQPNK